MRQFHFISGLPRSGSTLLGALLAQNPRFHADMTSPVDGLFTKLLEMMSARSGASNFFDDDFRRRMLRGLFDNYYADSSAEVIFDINRHSCARMDALAELFPEHRVIACVRDVAWVIDSIERLVTENCFSPSSMFGFGAGGTAYTRASHLGAADGMVGSAYDGLKQAYFGRQANRLLVVQYDTLVSDPQGTLAAVYDSIGEENFPHDFEHVDFDDRCFDARAGTPGLHRVRPRVSPLAREPVLPPDLFSRYEGQAFWREPQLNLYGVQVV